MVRCLPEMFEKVDNYEYLYQVLLLDRMYCPDPTSNISIKGVHNSKGQVYGKVTLKMCDWYDNSTCDFSAGTYWVYQRQLYNTFSSTFYVYVLDKAVYPN